jgi:predicted nuclease of restriction endonuclease-like (RecB) superfamily
MSKIQPSDLPFDQDLHDVYQPIAHYIRRARSNVLKSVNTEQVLAYWHIGKTLVEKEQEGKIRADYGKKLIKELSSRLNDEFGKGFGSSNLAYMKQFYLTYPNRIFHEPRGKSAQANFSQNLSWTHYRLLMRETRKEARSFYEIEAEKNSWSTPQLERQMTTFLYDRLAASKDEKGVMRLANKGQTIEKPEDALKNPVILSFLGYKEHHTYTETQLESAIIDHLQEFLLEMGRGFAFIARQKRLTIEGDYFKPDLIFYHTILKSYVIIDLKTDRLKHENIGQMMMYVNYFDRKIKQPDDNPTIGLLLCAAQNESVVKYTLPENNNQIFARKYQLHLPTIEELKQELQREYQDAKKQIEKNEEAPNDDDDTVD